MTNPFLYDVFLSHSSKDKAGVRPLAERLRLDGLRVWFDEWEIKPGDSIPAKIEEGLEHSHVLVLCMSANAFGSDWAQLEAGTFRFRDPLNKERRFIPLRLDQAPIKGSLAQFRYIKWPAEEREQEYAQLLEACRSSATLPLAEVSGRSSQAKVEAKATGKQAIDKAIQLDQNVETTLLVAWEKAPPVINPGVPPAHGSDGSRSAEEVVADFTEIRTPLISRKDEDISGVPTEMGQFKRIRLEVHKIRRGYVQDDKESVFFSGRKLYEGSDFRGHCEVYQKEDGKIIVYYESYGKMIYAQYDALNDANRARHKGYRVHDQSAIQGAAATLGVELELEERQI